MSRLSKISIAFSLLSISLFCGAQQLAFPGAEGYGRFASGGRGNGENGRVVEVTTLEDDVENPPEGSLRWAFTQATEEVIDPVIGAYTAKLPLTIVFRVGGVINLQDDLRVSRNNVTIAGQTAPGDGICIRGATVNLGGSRNVIIRHIRFRPGDELNQEISCLRLENSENFIIDHCSMSWAIEENTHFSSSKNLTVQWCVVSESLYNSIHKKGQRGYAAQWGGQYASYHHNLLAHNNSRNPRINGSNSNDIEALVDYRNNVNYNWGSSGAFYGGEWEGTPNCTGFSHVNVVNNYFIPGPATSGEVIAAPSLNRDGVELCGYAQWYVNGNVMVGRTDITADNWIGISSSYKDDIRSDTEHMKSDGTLENYDNYTETAEEAYISVLESAGAILPKRDVIDARIVAEAKGEQAVVRYAYSTDDGQNTPIKGVGSGIIDTQMNLVPTGDQDTKTAWDVYTSSSDAPTDTDHDGIPDEWESTVGLNPDDITDGRLIAGNGYSHLENYLNNVLVYVSVRDKQFEKNFSVYPNPVEGLFYIHSNESIVQIDLFELNGKKVMSVENHSGITSIQVDELQAGMYILRAVGIHNSYSEKVMKK